MKRKIKVVPVSRPGFYVLQKMSEESILEYFRLCLPKRTSSFPVFYGEVDCVIRRRFSIIVHDTGAVVGGKFLCNSFKIVGKKKE